MKKEKRPSSGKLLSFVKDPRFPLYLTLLLVALHLMNTFVVKNNVVQTVLGLFVVFFAPGHVWLDVLAGKTRINEISERIVTAIALSIGFVILSVSFASLVLKIPLTQGSVVLIIALVCLLGLGARTVFLKKRG